MIPQYTECMLPLLQYMSDKKIHSLKECVQIMSKEFRLSNEEQIQLLPSGKTTVIHHRTGWAKWHLEKIGMIKTVSRGKYRITEDGLKFLQTTPPTKERPFREYGY